MAKNYSKSWICERCNDGSCVITFNRDHDDFDAPKIVEESVCIHASFTDAVWKEQEG